MKKLLCLLSVLILISGCTTYDRSCIWLYESFIDDSLKDVQVDMCNARLHAHHANEIKPEGN